MESFGENKIGNRKLTIPNMIIILSFPFFTKPNVRWSSRLLIFVISLCPSVIIFTQKPLFEVVFLFLRR
jgi:hypothetical protein